MSPPPGARRRRRRPAVGPARHRRRDHPRAGPDLGGGARPPHRVRDLAGGDPADRGRGRDHLRGGARRAPSTRGERDLRRAAASPAPMLGARVNARVSERALRMFDGDPHARVRAAARRPARLRRRQGGPPARRAARGAPGVPRRPGRLPRRPARRRRRRDRHRGDSPPIGVEPGAGPGDRDHGHDPDRHRRRAPAPPPGHAGAARRAPGRARRDAVRGPRRVHRVRGAGGGAAHGVRRLPAARQLPDVPRAAAPAGARSRWRNRPRSSGYCLSTDGQQGAGHDVRRTAREDLPARARRGPRARLARAAPAGARDARPHDRRSACSPRSGSARPTG